MRDVEFESISNGGLQTLFSVWKQKSEKKL